MFCDCNIFMPKLRFSCGNDHKADERLKYFCATHRSYVDLNILEWDRRSLVCFEITYDFWTASKCLFFNSKIYCPEHFSIILTGHFIYRWTSTFDGTWGRAAGWAGCSATWRCSECERRESSFPTPRDSRRRQRSSRDSKLRRPYDKCRSCHHSLSISKQQLPSSLKRSVKN